MGTLQISTSHKLCFESKSSTYDELVSQVENLDGSKNEARNKEVQLKYH